MAENFDVKLDNKTYIPDPSYQAHSALGDYKKAYAEFLSDPEGFWAGKARELDWIKPWDKVKEWNWPNAQWFCGGKLNISANCLDRHVKNGKRNKLALIWKGEKGKEDIYTYRQLYRAVMRFANALKKLGVQKGDRICLYMPLVPEHIIAMLACARIGAVHSIV